MESRTQYKPPNVTTLLGRGSTASIWKHATRPNVIVKAPIECWWKSCEPGGELHNKFSVESQIFEKLGEHQNIAWYLGHKLFIIYNYYNAVFKADVALLIS